MIRPLSSPCSLLLFGAVVWAASVGRARPLQPPVADPDIQAAVAAVDPERIQRSIYVLASFRTRHTLSDPLPSGDGIGGAQAWIRAEFERIAAHSGGRLEVTEDSFMQPAVQPRVPYPVRLANIVATLPGSTPESAARVYVICAHADSRVKNILDASSPSPGANDDAAGVAALLEMARVLSACHLRTTVVFLVTTGEEQGLLGANHWAAEAARLGVNVEGMLDDDIIGNSRDENGGSHRHEVRLFAQGVPAVERPDQALLALLRAGGENDTAPRELARSVCASAAAYVPDLSVRLVYRTDRYLRAGDQVAFLDRGYPAVRFTEPAEDYRRQHEDVRVEKGVSYGDIVDHVDFAYVADVTRINVAALAVLARAPAPPQDVEIEAARLENDTTLRWRPGTESILGGYRVVWRETTAAQWQEGLEVPAYQTRVTLKGISKDNLIFGVEALDAAGHASRAVFPRARLTL